MKILNNLDLALNQVLNFLAQKLASDPGSPTEGQIWYNTTGKQFKGRTDTATVVLGSTSTDASTLQGQNSAYHLARANHTGTQLASTVSDFDTQVRLSRLDQMAVPTASVSLNSQKIINLAEPTASADAATKAYVDAAAQGLSAKDSVRAATTAAGTLSSSFANGSAVDGVTLATGDRILIKNQTAGAENGIYTVNASGAPTRALDFDSAAEIQRGAFVFVEEGTTNADSGWVLTTDGAITLGTTALAFTQFSGAGQITAGTGLTKTGNTLAIDTASGYGVRKYAVSVGDGSAVAYTLTHNLNTRDVTVGVYTDSGAYDKVQPDVEHATVNTVILRFATAPASNAYRAVIVG